MGNEHAANDVIAVKDIVKHFGDTKALQGVSFSIPKQQIFGLLGPSGAGKTTLIKILTGQMIQDSGKAFVNGVDCNAIDETTYATMGQVLDTTGLYERLSVWQNLALYAEIFKVDKVAIPAVLEEVGLLQDKNKAVSKLSKGMRQRLDIARATLHKPTILFLDEPSTGLDPVTMNQIHDKILTLRDEGATIFLTTHNMEEAYKLCDMVALLNEGHIVEMDEPVILCRKYNEKNEIEIVLKDGSKKTLTNSPESAPIIAAYLKDNAIQSIHSSEPNLEHVFIRLTGRGLVS